MYIDFQTWLNQRTIEEASRRDQMSFVDPHAEKGVETKAPKAGDILVTATSTFFRGPKARAFWKSGTKGPRRLPNNKINPWFLESDQKIGVKGDPEIEQAGLVGKNYYDAVYIPNPSIRKKFPADDIMYDVTAAYPKEDRYGKSVWLFIPSDDPEKQAFFVSAYDKFLKKHHAGDPAEFARQADRQEDLERAKMIHAKASILGDPSQAVHLQANADRLRFYRNLAAQVSSMLKHGDDPSLLLKRSFADESQKADPGFIDWLRRKGMNILADYLEGRDISAAFAKPADDFNQRLAFVQNQPRIAPGTEDEEWERLLHQKQGEKKGDLDTKWNQLMGAYKKAQSDERDPLAALKRPFPVAKAESIFCHGVKLLGEARRSFYQYY